MAFIETSSPIPKGNASAENVLKDKTFSNDNGVNLVGTMPDNTTRTSNGNVPGLSASSPNVPLRDALDLIVAEGTDGIKRLAMQPPQGYYQGNNASFIGRNASELGNATASDVLSGKTFTSENGIKIAGSIPTTESEYATRVGYYSPDGDYGANSYGHVHPPSKYYGNLTNNSWAPEVKLTKQQMFDICDGNILPFSLDFAGGYWGASSTEHWIRYNYTIGNYSSLKAIFFGGLVSSYQALNSTTTIIAKINDVDQNLIWVSDRAGWDKFFYFVTTLNKGDKVYFEIKYQNSSRGVNYCIGRVQNISRGI